MGRTVFLAKSDVLVGVCGGSAKRNHKSGEGHRIADPELPLQGDVPELVKGVEVLLGDGTFGSDLLEGGGIAAGNRPEAVARNFLNHEMASVYAKSPKG